MMEVFFGAVSVIIWNRRSPSGGNVNMCAVTCAAQKSNYSQWTSVRGTPKVTIYTMMMLQVKEKSSSVQQVHLNIQWSSRIRAFSQLPALLHYSTYSDEKDIAAHINDKVIIDFSLIFFANSSSSRCWTGCNPVTCKFVNKESIISMEWIHTLYTHSPSFRW